MCPAASDGATPSPQGETFRHLAQSRDLVTYLVNLNKGLIFKTENSKSSYAQDTVSVVLLRLRSGTQTFISQQHREGQTSIVPL